MQPLSLFNVNQVGIIESIVASQTPDPIAQRLAELGFVKGETVQLVATGPVGKEPLLIKIGTSKFALRRSEASRVYATVLES